MAITLQKENFAKSTLDGNILIGAGSLDVQAADGLLFPQSGPFRAVLWGAAYATPQDDANREIVEAEIDSAGSDTFDITRAQESTTAKGWSDGDHFALVLTKETIEEIEDAIELEHNATGTHKIPLMRAQFGWSDTDTITLETAAYDHNGTIQQTVYWDSQIVFDAGADSADSNPDSTALGSSEQHYIYIDDSAVVTLGSPELTDSELLNSTTAPTWDDAKRGWYNGDDKCIGYFLTDGAGNILEFNHSGDFVAYADGIADRAAATVTDSFVGETLTAPAFCTKVELSFYWQFAVAGSAVYWRTTGNTGTVGNFSGYVAAGVTESMNTFLVITNASQSIDIRESNAGPNCLLTITTHGWYFPIGM